MIFLAKISEHLIEFYQKTISPDHGVFSPYAAHLRCRFYPSCSEYARQSIRQYGLPVGIVVSLKRIFRCGPWSVGGYDPAGAGASIPDQYARNKASL